jgi:hypothetical protein
VTYQLDRDARFIETFCSGDTTLTEVLRHLRELEADPTLPERLDVLLDLGEQTSIPESAQLREVARAIEQAGKNGRWGSCAIVAPSDVLFGMSRMFEVFAEGVFASSRVFREREAARRWLASARSAPR